MNKTFMLNEKEYFNCGGVDVMAFSDFYPAGHQSGISLIMHDRRVVGNSDIRFEHTPGQWQPVPKQVSRVVDKEKNIVVTTLKYPDIESHLHGFNPIIYPDFEFEYSVTAKGIDGGVEIYVNLNSPVPKEFAGKLSFNFELFPGILFGKSWIMDESTGLFPRQPNAPTKKVKSNLENSGHITPKAYAHADILKLADTSEGYNPIVADDIIAMPLATGHCFTVAPECKEICFSVECKESELSLYDGRMNHNNGWFVLNAEFEEGSTGLCLTIKPCVIENWVKDPVIQVSQVGYHPGESKVAYLELDPKCEESMPIELQTIGKDGIKTVKTSYGKEWGRFLRYKYLTFDFSDVTCEGLYRIAYGNVISHVFRIAHDVYERGVWQPVLEYFLPVQMCHMRVNEKYRVWHGRCHCDDARMAPTNYEQFDGAAQGADTLTKFKPGDHIPGVNAGGWHDAGDFDLRIESQTGECYILSSAYEEFDVYWDETKIDQETKTVEIHEPDGKNDILQQIEHGLLSVTGAYKSMGRLYHEIMCGKLRQYVLLGDSVNMTEGTEDNPTERLLFTEDNPPRELNAAAHLAASYRALKDYNSALATDALKIAVEIFDKTSDHAFATVPNDYDASEKKIDRTLNSKIHAASELFLSTKEEKYRQFILNSIDYVCEHFDMVGFAVCRVIHELESDEAYAKIRKAVTEYVKEFEMLCDETPYMIPYKPNIWGAGWDIQALAFRYYFVCKAFPDIVSERPLFRALQFILGCHPGSNTASFASGVGAKSATVAYGINRADYSYIPGGVVSGTALIRPDFPELLEFPYLWQQAEYVLGGGSSNYMFLVLAAKKLLAD